VDAERGQPELRHSRRVCNSVRDDLDDCKRQFKETWATLRADLTDADIALAFEMRRD